MILLIDLCYREDSLGFDEYVLPVARIVERLGFRTRSVHFHAVSAGECSGVKAVILCGTPLADNAFLDEPEDFSWLKTSRIPVLGVCAGMETICRIFGGKLEPCIEIGMTEIRVTGRDPLFPESHSFSAYELHTLACTDPGPMKIIAVSDRCIQVVRHPTKPVYGVMFHPEVRNEWAVERFLSMTRKDGISP
ncbi:MAG: glutamine amidotransferase [Methanoregulaceae archaeon]|nr:glutamine amidotransferase [Methanoregulaceae archaeon]